MKFSWLIILLLLICLFKQLIFSAVTPIWHTPDEQAHFAQVAFFSEMGHMPTVNQPLDANNEIYQSEKLLGTLRDQNGNNNFTFHPEYKIEYTNSLTGKYETQIDSFPKEYRTTFVKQEAANYPPLFYWYSSFFYHISYNLGLIDRVFSTRFGSILLFLCLIVTVHFTSKIIFPRSKLNQLTVTILVAFQPMLSFLNAGTNSDNLLNLLFTLLIFLCVSLIRQGVKLKNMVFLFIVLILGLLTKPQFILAIPVFILALWISLLLNNRGKHFFKLSALAILLMPIIIFMIMKVLSNPSVRVDRLIFGQSFFPGPPRTQLSLGDFISFFTESLRHTYAEVMPWYWGVFDWLGVTYPRIVHRLVNWIVLIAAIGVLVKFRRLMRRRNTEDYLFLFLVGTSLIYFLGITFYNYLFFLNHGFPFGIQGRYYFPAILAHMTILLIGLKSIIPKKYDIYKALWIKVVGLSMIAFNFIGVGVIVNSYYNLSNLNTLIIQMSQYKPEIFKGSALILLFSVYAVLLFLLIRYYLKINSKLGEN